MSCFQSLGLCYVHDRVPPNQTSAGYLVVTFGKCKFQIHVFLLIDVIAHPLWVWLVFYYIGNQMIGFRVVENIINSLKEEEIAVKKEYLNCNFYCHERNSMSKFNNSIIRTGIASSAWL